MASQARPDPFEMWRQALSKLESDMNALSNRGMNSDDFSRALQRFSGVALGMQHVLDKAVRTHLKALNLPSRNDIEQLAAALQRIEEKLDRLLPAPRPAGAKPARTRRPAAEAGETPPPAPAPKRARQARPARPPRPPRRPADPS
jgi:hypothetical protein